MIRKQVIAAAYYSDSHKRRHMFCKCCFFQAIPSTPLNGSLGNFWLLAPNKTGS